MSSTLKICQWHQNSVKIKLNSCSLTPELEANNVAKDCQKDSEKWNCNRELKAKQNFRAESSRKFNKILQKSIADFEKSQNYKIELEKWKKNYCIWQGQEGTRAQGHISKWAVTDWEILALFTFLHGGGAPWRACTHFSYSFPMKFPFLLGNSLSC